MEDKAVLFGLEESLQKDVFEEVIESVAKSTYNQIELLQKKETSKKNREEDEMINTNTSIKDKCNNYAALQLYKNDIRRLSKKSKTEQHELFKKFRGGDKEAKKELIESNLPLVIWIAKKIRYSFRDEGLKSGLDITDLIQDGNLGLIRAVEKYDPWMINPNTNEPYKFSTYAPWWIKQSMLRGISKQIRLPVYMTERIRKYNKICDKLIQKSASQPSREEIAQEMSLPVDKIMNIEMYKSIVIISLESKVDEDSETTLEDMLENKNAPRPDENIENLQFSIKAILRMVPAGRSRGIMRMRYLENKTLADIGKEYGITRERVRQINEIGLKRLQESVKLQ